MSQIMDTRRVQITGGSSFMVTLPKYWADSVNLKKNDMVSLSPQPNGGLLITTGDPDAVEDRVKTLEIDRTMSSERIYRCLIGAYIAGHDRIVIHSDQPLAGQSLDAISRFTQTSIGMEIVEEEENRIVIKDLMDHTEISPQKNIRREFLLVKRMISDVLNSDQVSPAELESRDTEVDRIHWLVQRQSSIHQQNIGLSVKMGIDLRNVTNCVGISKTLERMGDHTVLIAKQLGSLNDGDRVTVRGILSNLSPEIAGFVETSMDSWFNANADTAENLILRKTALTKNVSDRFSDLRGNPGGSLIEGSCTRLIEYCSDIAESAIDLAMEQQ